MSGIRKALIATLSVALMSWGLVACEPPPECPDGWTAVSSQSWWQNDANNDGRADFPQTLVDGEGGHMHVELCFPINQRVDGTVDLKVHLGSHQGYTAHGDKLDIGLAPGGSSVARVSAPDLVCGPKPAFCEGEVDISLDTDRLPSGLQSLRLRYLPANHPSGDRQFTGSEYPVWVRSNPGTPDFVGGKGWFSGVSYANTRFRGDIPRGPVSGNWTFQLYTKGDNVEHALVHVDADFGRDDEGTEVFHSASEYRGPVTIDTTRFSNGLHRLSLRADSSTGGGVLTGVFEIAINIQNGGGGTTTSTAPSTTTTTNPCPG